MTKFQICPDCETEVDSLTTSGICQACHKRKLNRKSRKMEYVPLKDIKGTREYRQAMSRRQNSSLKKQDQKDTKNTQNSIASKESINEALEGYDYIDVNSNMILQAVRYLEKCLNQVPEIEKQVTDIQEEMLVITHKKTETAGPGDPEFERLNNREYQILKYRRGLKDALVYLRKVNPDILNKDLTQELSETQERYEVGGYLPKQQSRAKQYVVSVNVSGLKGSSKVEIFRRYVYSNSSEQAKAYVENFLNTLRGVTIYGKSWKIIEVGDVPNINDTKE